MSRCTITEKDLEPITRTIVQAFNPEQIILFGSLVWGKAGPDSDADLFIVKETQESTRDVAREIDGALWGRTIPLDIIVSTPEGLQKSLKSGNLFIRDIVERGKVLYERRRQR